MLLAENATLSILSERNRIPPWGLYGGKSGALGEFYILKPNGKLIKLKSKCTQSMTKGDILIIKTPGGGGYGDPLRRKPELVLRDVIDGLVSEESAQEDYGVAIVDSEIDWKATERLRTNPLLSDT